MPELPMSRLRRLGSANRKPSDLFEQRIHRIHELIEGFGAEVAWNEHVADPDQPSRRRQIDVTIKRDGRLTFVECRLHSSPQNVKWIEELIGRRQSLGAHSVIAVSASGFTKGAVAKANRHDILLRDLRQLSDEEVREWGRSVTMTLYFFAYSDMVLGLTFPIESVTRVDPTQLLGELRQHPIVTSMFNAAAQLVSQKLIPAVEDQNLTANFAFRLQLEPVKLCGEPVLAIDVRGKARMVARQLTARAHTYGAPSQKPATRDAVVERYSIGDTEIVHDGSRVSTHIDLATLQLPPLHQFRYAAIAGQEMLEHDVLSFRGTNALNVQNGSIGVEIFGSGLL